MDKLKTTVSIATRGMTVVLSGRLQRGVVKIKLRKSRLRL